MLLARELLTNYYWQTPFRPIGTRVHLTEFVVLDVEPTRTQNGKYLLCELTVARNCDLGKNDRQFYINSHLGHILNPGDYVLGYDLSTLNMNDSDLNGVNANDLPEVVIVKKIYHRTGRRFKLKALTKEHEQRRKNDAEKAEYVSLKINFRTTSNLPI